ncbi:MAG: L-seryl-tRNA(Sec) selenium transferase [Deltaproteobacteria bacterium]|nr:L-seryl-tRNA(Sec) selenium transferase [Deltaproteobacteria bacterium]
MASETSKINKRNEAGIGSSLRALPSIDLCLKAALADARLCDLSRDYLKKLARDVQDQLRAQPELEAVEAPAGQLLEWIIERIVAVADSDESKLRAVINATGISLHTNLGRALLAESAIRALTIAATSPINLEYDFASGARGDRDHTVEDELRELTGAEAATVVNNNAAAVLLVLNSLAAGREVIVSRGELIEIGGSFRLPDVMTRSGARLREVGTTNRTHPRDYEEAIGPETALLLKVHPSNYRIIGFTHEVGLPALVEIGRNHGIEVVEDLGAGALIDLARYGLPREPVVRDRIAAGSGIVTFSGDKLLGGPQAGIIVGRRDLIERVRENPLKRALRCDKLTLAALEATLRLYRRGDIANALPTLRLLRRTAGEIEVTANRVREILRQRLPNQFQLEVVHGYSKIGSGSLPTAQLESRAVRITHPTLSAGSISAMFRHARPSVIGRVSEGAFFLDCRMIEDPSVLAVDFASERHRRRA